MASGAKFLLVQAAILLIGKMLRSLRQLGWQTWSGSGNWKELVEPSFGHRADHWSQRRSQITKVESCLRTKFLRQKFWPVPFAAAVGSRKFRVVAAVQLLVQHVQLRVAPTKTPPAKQSKKSQELGLDEGQCYQHLRTINGGGSSGRALDFDSMGLFLQN